MNTYTLTDSDTNLSWTRACKRKVNLELEPYRVKSNSESRSQFWLSDYLIILETAEETAKVPDWIYMWRYKTQYSCHYSHWLVAATLYMSKSALLKTFPSSLPPIHARDERLQCAICTYLLSGPLKFPCAHRVCTPCARKLKQDKLVVMSCMHVAS